MEEKELHELLDTLSPAVGHGPLLSRVQMLVDSFKAARARVDLLKKEHQAMELELAAVHRCFGALVMQHGSPKTYLN